MLEVANIFKQSAHFALTQDRRQLFLLLRKRNGSRFGNGMAPAEEAQFLFSVTP